MKGHKAPTTGATNLGSYDSSTAAKITGIPANEQGLHPLTKFHNDVASATMLGPEDDLPLPIVETTEEVCVFLNGKVGPRVEAFKKDGYFNYGDVAVCVEGNREKIATKLRAHQTGPSHGVWVNGTQGTADFLRAEAVAEAAEAKEKARG